MISIKISKPPLRFLLSTVLALTFPHAGFAQNVDPNAPDTVILQSRDGTISIQGKYLSFDSGFYVVDTGRMGIMRIDANKVNCAGAPCALALEAATTAPAAPEVAASEPASAEAANPAPAAEAAPATAASTETVAFSFGIHGSRTVGTTLIPTLLRGYAESLGGSLEVIPTDDPAVRIAKLMNADGSVRAVIDLQTKGSGSAIPALIEGTADIGVTDRPMNSGDVEKLTAAGQPDLRNTPDEFVLGVDGIVVILNTANPLRDLSAEEVAKIFAGEITNWRELGGDDLPIRIHSYEEGSGDREVLLNGLVRPFGRGETAEVARHADYYKLVEAVTTEPGAIGYVGRWLARSSDVKLMPIREVCGLQSEPSDFRMKIEGYSLSRRLFAFKLPGAIHPEARAFLDWTQTREAQPYIKEANFIDRELERMPLADVPSATLEVASAQPEFNSAQHKKMVEELGTAERLSLSFRFKFASSQLDSEGAKTVEQIARLIASGEFEGKEILLVGFADSVGTSGKNTTLAKARAEEVRSILRSVLSSEAVDAAALVPLSFGEMMPLSCNEDDVGRERNRRVEVWLR
jgi:phosphate transport system substrate-binding protein